MKKSRGPTLPPTIQPEAPLNQAGPVQDTYYPILDTTRNCRVVSVAVRVNDTGETLQVRITVDGQAFISEANACGAGADFMVVKKPVTAALTQYTLITSASWHAAFLDEGKSVKVEVRKTTAVGAGNLLGKVVYAIWP